MADACTTYGEEWRELMKFTNGKWDTMDYDDRSDTLEKYKVHVAETQRRRAWKELCPAEYCNTCPEQLPNAEKFEQVQNWQYGPQGLVVLGPTRRGKTRSVWGLLRRLHF